MTTFAIITNLLVSGSRSAFGITIILILSTIVYFYFFLLVKSSNKTLTKIIFISLAGVVLTQTFFHNQFSALVDRADGAAKLAGKDAVIGFRYITKNSR